MFFSNRKMQVTYLSEFTGPISPTVSIFKVYRVNIFKSFFSRSGVQILFFFTLLPILTWSCYLTGESTVLLQFKCSYQIKLKGLLLKFECQVNNQCFLALAWEILILKLFFVALKFKINCPIFICYIWQLKRENKTCLYGSIKKYFINQIPFIANFGGIIRIETHIGGAEPLSKRAKSPLMCQVYLKKNG